MDESLYSLSFADQKMCIMQPESSGGYITIKFGSNVFTAKVQSILDAKPSLKDYIGKAGTCGDWDLKSNTVYG